MSLWCTAWPSHPLSEVKKTNVSSSIPASFKTDMIVPTASSNSFCGCEGHKTLQCSNEYVRVTIGNFKLVQIATIKLASKNRLWLKNWKWFKQLWRKCRLSTLTQAQLDLSYFLSPVTIPCREKIIEMYKVVHKLFVTILQNSHSHSICHTDSTSANTVPTKNQPTNAVRKKLELASKLLHACKNSAAKPKYVYRHIIYVNGKITHTS